MDGRKGLIVVCIGIFIVFLGSKIIGVSSKKEVEIKEISLEKDLEKRILEKETIDREGYEIKVDTFKYEEKSKRLNLNEVEVEDMLSRKISLKLSEKIVEYREITGAYEDKRELKRISGIGDKTYEKIKGNFYVPKGSKKKPFNINKASNLKLKYYGFTKSEIKKIERKVEVDGRIFDNIELSEILSKTRYNKYKEIVLYN